MLALMFRLALIGLVLYFAFHLMLGGYHNIWMHYWWMRP